jgi:hypothetical protein
VPGAGAIGYLDGNDPGARDLLVHYGGAQDDLQASSNDGQGRVSLNGTALVPAVPLVPPGASAYVHSDGAIYGFPASGDIRFGRQGRPDFTAGPHRYAFLGPSGVETRA